MTNDQAKRREGGALRELLKDWRERLENADRHAQDKKRLHKVAYWDGYGSALACCIDDVDTKIFELYDDVEKVAAPSEPTDAMVEAAAKAICSEWGYIWDAPPDDEQATGSGDWPDERPTKELYRLTRAINQDRVRAIQKAARAALRAAGGEK